MTNNDLTKIQFIEVQEMIKSELKPLKNDVSEIKNNRLPSIESGLLTLQVKNGVFATIFGAVASYITAMGFKFYR